MYDPTPHYLSTLKPNVRERATILINWLRENGIPALVISGRRTREQNIAAGGAKKSRHLSGSAFDVQIQGYTRDQVPMEFWQAVGEVAEKYLKLRWGGRFKERDVNHFDSG